MRFISQLSSAALSLVLDVYDLLFDYRQLRFKFQYGLLFGYASNLLIHLSQLVEVVIRSLFKKCVGFLLPDQVKLLLSQLIIPDRFYICDESLQSLIHLQHLVFGRDLFDLFVQRQGF
jgi:hypothetical protein